MLYLIPRGFDLAQIKHYRLLKPLVKFLSAMPSFDIQTIDVPLVT
jgi:hypothetical protein